MARDFQRPFTRPAGAVELLLVRHGSSGGAGGQQPGALVDGHSDPPLSDAGHRQAEAVAERLAAEPIGALFVTPLRRTAETAAPLAQRLGLAPAVVGDLREVHLGAWEGKLHARLADSGPLAAEVFERERWDVIPGAEAMEAFAARVQRGLDHVADTTGPDATSVAVVHGGVIAEACRQATGSTPFAFLYADNASITRLLRLPSRRWALAGFNDVGHLAALREPA
jgi:probable phosphoglycerate mutase